MSNLVRLVLGGAVLATSALVLKNKVENKKDLEEIKKDNILNYVFVFTDSEIESELFTKLKNFPDYIGSSLTNHYTNLGVSFSNKNNQLVFKPEVYSKKFNNDYTNLAVTVNVYKDYLDDFVEMEKLESDIRKTIKKEFKKYCELENIPYKKSPFNFECAVMFQDTIKENDIF